MRVARGIHPDRNRCDPIQQQVQDLVQETAGAGTRRTSAVTHLDMQDHPQFRTVSHQRRVTPLEGNAASGCTIGGKAFTLARWNDGGIPVDGPVGQVLPLPLSVDHRPVDPVQSLQGNGGWGNLGLSPAPPFAGRVIVVPLQPVTD